MPKLPLVNKSLLEGKEPHSVAVLYHQKELTGFHLPELYYWLKKQK